MEDCGAIFQLMASSDVLLSARLQMALTLAFHIIFACIGVGFPLLLVIVEGLWLKTENKVWKQLAKQWSKSFAVLFVVGAVSGTILSFELGLLWPEFMGKYGSVVGILFTLEGFAFFTEAIFVGIYLYGWDSLSKFGHWLVGIPIAISGAASAAFVVTVNSWMQHPVGAKLNSVGEVIDVDPIAVFFNPVAPSQGLHTILSAYIVTGFVVAGYYAFKLLRLAKSEAMQDSEADNKAYYRSALSVPLVMAMVATPLQLAVGHWSAEVVAEYEPVKLAAMEGQWETEKGAPLRIGGWVFEQEQRTDYALEIPYLLSLLATHDINGEVKGLKEIPPNDRPPVLIVHLGFQTMVGLGTLMLLFSAITAWIYWRQRKLPEARWFYGALVALAPASIVAMECGWIVTEVGRQPWIVHGVLRTSDAVTEHEGTHIVLILTVILYLGLSVGTVTVLRNLAPSKVDSSEG